MLRLLKLLLNHPDINANQAEEYGWTPLWIAVNQDREKVVKMLLATYHHIDVLAKPKRSNRTPAEQAKANRHLEIYE